MMNNDFNADIRRESWNMYNRKDGRSERVMSKATMDMCHIPAQFYTAAGNKPLVTSTLGLDTWLANKTTKELPETVDFISNYLKNIKQVDEAGYGVVMQGPNGTGKSMVACAMAYEWMKLFPVPKDNGVNHAYFITMSDLRRWMDLRKSFNAEDKKEFYQIKHDLEHRGFLILDDVVDVFKSDESLERELFVRLLKTRAEANLINIVITNMPLANFLDAFGKTLGDILQAKGKVIKVEGRIREKTPLPPWER